jgi:serine/threonine-protein kinase
MARPELSHAAHYWREIDAVCERFEKAWQRGERPRVEEYLLGNMDEPTRSGLLMELLKMDLEYRRKHGEQPEEAEYRARFGTEQQRIIAEVFATPARNATVEVPGYQLLEKLGQGGMGVVYRAVQVKADRPVALKMLISGELASSEEVERFKAEARAIAALDHPNIVSIYDVGEYAGRPFFSMKLYESGSLADRIAHGPLPSQEAALTVRTVAEAIHHAHLHQIIHRDLKPGNILLDRAGKPCVTDFGLAMRLDGKDPRTLSGTVLGTPGYMAPEQALGKPATAATDVYGLGAVIYAVLTGRPPFQAETPFATLEQVVDRPPAPPRLLNPNIDEDLETICLKCLEKEPAARYASARELQLDLDRYRSGQPIQARPPSWLKILARQLARRVANLDDPLSWSRISFLGAAIAFAIHLAIFWITQPGGPIGWFPALVGLNGAVVVVVTWYFLLRRRQPFSAEERDHAAFFGCVAMTAFLLYVLTYPWRREEILAMYPALALLCGVHQFFFARLYWGPVYLYALAYYVLACVMKLQPEWAPLEFAVVFAVINVTMGVMLRRVEKKREKGKETGSG